MLPQRNNIPAVAWAASSPATPIMLNQLPRLVNQGIVHLAGFILTLAVTVVPAVGAATPGNMLCRTIDDFILRDSLGNDVINLKGWMVRLYSRLVTGHVTFADPADVALDPAQVPVVRTFRLWVPFIGGDKGIKGAMSRSDFLQPVDRFFDNGRIDITWGAATAPGAGVGTISAATLTITPQLEIRSAFEVTQGCDIRIGYHQYAAGAQFLFAFRGLKVLHASLANPDMDMSDYTRLDLLDLLVNCLPLERVASWNALHENQAVILSETTPEAIPIIFPMPHQGMTSLIGFEQSNVALDTVTAHAAAQFAIVAELHNREELVKRLWAAGFGYYRSLRGQYPKYADKNRPAVVDSKDQRKRMVLEWVGPAKLDLDPHFLG